MTKIRPWSELKAKIVSDPARWATVEEGTRAVEDGVALGRMRSELGMKEFDAPEPSGGTQSEVTDPEDAEDIYLVTLRS